MLSIFTGLFGSSDKTESVETASTQDRSSDKYDLRETINSPNRYHTEMETTYASPRYNGRYDKWDTKFNGHKIDERAFNDILHEANFDHLEGLHMTPSGYVCDDFVVDESLETDEDSEGSFNREHESDLDSIDKYELSDDDEDEEFEEEDDEEEEEEDDEEEDYE
jgi:hypothetical protein